MRGPRNTDIQTRHATRSRAAEQDLHSEPPQRRRADDGDADVRCVYVPKCRLCKDRGWVCYAVQSRQGAWGPCTPCRLGKSRCSASRVGGGSGASDGRGSAGGQRHGHGHGQLKIGPPGGKWMWEKRAERAARARDVKVGPPGGKWKWQQRDEARARRRSSATLSQSSVQRSVPAPSGLGVDKGVQTEGRGQLDPQETEFLKGLVSLILEVIKSPVLSTSDAAGSRSK